MALAGAALLGLAVLAAKLLSEPAAGTQLDSVAMRSLTSYGTFKTVQGDGSRALHVFLSTDCSYCRQVEPELSKLENVTVFRHLLPGHTEEGRDAAKKVWCSTEPVQAWKEIAAGDQISTVARSGECDVGTLEKNRELAKRLGVTSTPAMIYESGHISTGLFSAAELTNMLTKASIPTR